MLRPYTYSIPAGGEVVAAIVGGFFRIHDAEGDVIVSFDDTSSLQGITMPQGDQIETKYRKVRINSVTAQTITILAGFGSYGDHSEDINVTATANVSPGNALVNVGRVTIGAGVGGVVFAAAASTKTIIIKSLSTNANSVNIGTTGVGALTGYELESGESMSMSVTAEIAAFNTGGSDVVLCVLPVSGV